jgi:opacity protein-like surface antigen
MQVLTKSAIAIALAFPAFAMAQTTQELKAELDALKQHVKKLEAMIEKATAKPEGSGEVVEVAEFNRIKIKTEAAEDAQEANGFKNLKISGYIDPTYIYNKNAKTSSFVFLNNNSNINGSNEGFGYDNTYFGSLFLNLEKELEGGTKLKLTLVPSKGTASGYNFGNIVHEATASVPIAGDATTRMLVGQYADWTGYEAIPSNQNKLITHNLLFDFSAPNFYTGAGVEFIRDKWDIKTLIGNLNRARIDEANRQAPGLFYRGDYAKGEFTAFGFGGLHTGFDDKTQFGRLDIVEVDGSFTRGDVTLQGQLTYGRQKRTEGNGYLGEYARWYGLSTLGAYKLTPRLESIARFDYIYNKKDGGGLLGSTFGGVCQDSIGAGVNCPDGRNGFGSGLVFDGTRWVVADPTQGSNRYALSLGLNYAMAPGVNLKLEYRYDRSTANTFLDSNGNYRRDNHVFGLSSVLSF